MGVSTAMYQLRNKRLQVFGVDWQTAGMIRDFVLAISLYCGGLYAILVFREDVPIFFITVLPALLLGYSVAILYDRLSEREKFNRQKFWEITIAPCLTTLAPVSSALVKVQLILAA